MIRFRFPPVPGAPRRFAARDRPDKGEDKAAWRVIDALTARLEGEAARALERLLHRIDGRVDLAALAAAIRDGSHAGVLRALPLGPLSAGLSAALATALDGTARAAMGATAGQQMLWEDAINRGLLPLDQEKEWVATPGSGRTCERCLAMHGQRVLVTGLFEDRERSVSVVGPPLHVQCRCTTVLRVQPPPPERPG